MQTKQAILDNILNDIIKLESPKIDTARSKQLQQLIESSVNGDIPHSYLTIDADLSNNQMGSIAYILTDKKIIKICIDKSEAEAKSYFLDTIVGIERKILEKNRERTMILFQNDSIGLSYPQDEHTVAAFFQKIERPRSSSKPS